MWPFHSNLVVSMTRQRLYFHKLDKSTRFGIWHFISAKTFGFVIQQRQQVSMSIWNFRYTGLTKSPFTRGSIKGLSMKRKRDYGGFGSDPLLWLTTILILRKGGNFSRCLVSSKIFRLSRGRNFTLPLK
jgi:hypothetical protein